MSASDVYRGDRHLCRHGFDHYWVLGYCSVCGCSYSWAMAGTAVKEET